MSNGLASSIWLTRPELADRWKMPPATLAQWASRTYLREMLDQAEKLGFTPVGRAGNGHVRLRNADTGDRYSAAFSPSDRRSLRNTIAQLERLSGRKLPRDNSGKHRHRRQPQLDVTLSPAEQRASELVAALVAEAESVRRRIGHLAAEPTRDAVAEMRRAIAKFEHLRWRLAQRHHIVDPIGAAL
jgi:hypothetical protein